MNIQGNTLLTAFNQWANRPADERFQSLEDIHAFTHSRRMRSRGFEVKTRDIRATHDAETGLVINGAIHASTPSHWSFGQLSSWIGAPAAFLRDKLNDRPDLLTQNLNHCVSKAGKEDLKWLLVEPESDGLATLQAVTSPTYGRIWDADCVAAVQRLRERSGGKWYNPKAWAPGHFGDASLAIPSGLYASDRDVFMFMIDGGSLLDAGPRAQLNRGFIVTNSEVGKSTFTLTTFLFNQCCGNHIIWGARDVNTLAIRHSKNGPARFDNEAFPALMSYAARPAAEDENTLRKCAGFILPAKREDVLSLINKAAKFNNRELQSAFDVAKAEEGKCETMWDLVQGFTAHARSFEYVDARVDLETRAGKLIDLASSTAATVALPA